MTGLIVVFFLAICLCSISFHRQGYRAGGRPMRDCRNSVSAQAGDGTTVSALPGSGPVGDFQGRFHSVRHFGQIRPAGLRGSFDILLLRGPIAGLFCQEQEPLAGQGLCHGAGGDGHPLRAGEHRPALPCLISKPMLGLLWLVTQDYTQLTGVEADVHVISIFTSPSMFAGCMGIGAFLAPWSGGHFSAEGPPLVSSGVLLHQCPGFFPDLQYMRQRRHCSGLPMLERKSNRGATQVLMVDALILVEWTGFQPVPL